MEWCDGLPLQERRPLTAEERERFTAERKRYRLRAWLTTPGLLLGFVLVGVLASLTNATPDLRDGIVDVGAIGLIAIGLPFTILFTRDANQRSRQLRDDLRADCVVRYADETKSVEVLPVSRRLLASRGWDFAGPAIETADAPTDAICDMANAAVLDDVWDIPLGHRDLSPAEKDEIRRYARRTWLRPMWPAIFMTLWASIPLFILMAGEKLDVTPGSMRLLIVVFAALACDVAFAVAILTARKMGADRTKGTVEVRKEDRDSGRVTVEWLLHADREWTVDGRPADWRTIPVP